MEDKQQTLKKLIYLKNVEIQSCKTKYDIDKNNNKKITGTKKEEGKR